MDNNNTVLPAELRDEINKSADHYANVQVGKKSKITCPASLDEWEETKDDFKAGASEYAIKYHQAKELLTKLRDEVNLPGAISEKFYNEIKSFLDGRK